MPMIIASAVMSTGRMRVQPASSAASVRGPSLGPVRSSAKRDQQNAVRRRHADAHDRAHQAPAR